MSQAWPASTTEQSQALASDWQLFTYAGVAVAIVVGALIVFTAWRWRARGDGRAPARFANNAPLEIAWTLVPLAGVLALFVAAYRAEARVDALAAKPDVVIAVRAYRWGWSFAYRDGPTVTGAQDAPARGGIGGAPTPDLVLPLGETTRIDITSVDVIHSMWIPAFLYKRDAIPGQVNAFDVHPTLLGNFTGHCAAFCGLDHARMDFRVRVVTPAAFAAWRRGDGRA